MQVETSRGDIDKPKILLIDLNNFARYPSMSIGYIAAVLRGAGNPVRVFAPLMVGVKGVVRERRAGRFSLLVSQINHWIATSSSERLRTWRNNLANRRLSEINVHAERVLAAIRVELDQTKPAVALVSTYLMYRQTCEAIAALCRERQLPLLVGGPYFTQDSTISDWASIPGVTAIAAGELEDRLPEVVKSMARGDSLASYSGIVFRDADGALHGGLAPPLQNLDDLPIPDYRDYPWHLYPNRIIPVITGRGCGWGMCTFCSDVTSTAGRTFRSRSPDNVIREIASHHVNYGVSRFVFTDLKLNSNVEVWRSLHAKIRKVAPLAEWIGAVHVGPEDDNGLSRDDLRAAAASGCVRLTTGLETGSQRIATLMRKGTRLEAISLFLHDATEAGISCRCTMVTGYLGETPSDIDASTAFLDKHAHLIERVTLNRLQIATGTDLHRLVLEKHDRFRGVRIVGQDVSMAQVEYSNSDVERIAHRTATMRLQAAAHRINSKTLSPRAREFEGVM